ncbi:hypothetical protein Naga_100512g3 [Nannochloropsis gaditana]|uniref:Uncharacterized protein n=1 Tax=Nannochloropsis gaditana TaxID=72520 RepID=W7TLU7_9STRA|nr:hypothetical protein Naga_100512g3 [Nannochloropsis gaditana]
MKRRRASTFLLALPRALFLSLLSLPYSAHAGFFRHDPPPAPGECTYVENIYIEDAVNALAKCVEVSPDGIRNALQKQTDKDGEYILGELYLKNLNECLEKVKKDGGSYNLDDKCNKYVEDFQATGDSSNGKEAGGIVAKKMMYNTDKFCYCMATIDPSEIFCYGLGVAPAIKSIRDTCDLLDYKYVQKVLTKPPKPVPPPPPPPPPPRPGPNSSTSHRPSFFTLPSITVPD